MTTAQVLENCRKAEDLHGRCRTDESRRAAAINVLHWTQEWSRRHGVFCRMLIGQDGYIDAEVMWGNVATAPPSLR